MPIDGCGYSPSTPTWCSSRLHQVGLFLALIGILLLGIPAGSPAIAQNRDALILSEVQVEGATRTQQSTILRHLQLRPGQAISQDELLAGVQQLRNHRLFAEVDFYTRPGRERGHLVLVLEVKEHSFDFRWGLGHTDLDGWYLSSLVLARDNSFGQGGLLDFQVRSSFRHSGLMLRYAQPYAGDGRTYWEVRLHAPDTDRPYFFEGVEYEHEVSRVELGFRFGRRLTRSNLLEAGLRVGRIHSAETSEACNASPDGSIAADQDIGLEDQPQAIAEATGRSRHLTWYLDWQHDSRGSGRRAGSPTSGFWGRIKATLAFQESHTHPGLLGDLRSFHAVPGGVLATRIHAAWVGRKAAFYNRLYLGGIYNVRGFSTHSLSAPGGDTWLTAASLEYRSRIFGKGERARLTGLIFLDAGFAGADDAVDPYKKLAASVGYGIRYRIPRLGLLGVDVGFPLTERPLDRRFQVNGSMGWSF